MTSSAKAAGGVPDGVIEESRGHRSFLKRVSGDVLRISGAVGLAQLLAFAASPLLTRLYSPDAFGHFAVLGAIVTTLTPLASLRYGWALPLPREEGVARDLLALCLIVVAGFAAVVGIAGTVLWTALEGWFTIRPVDIALLAVTMLVIGLHEVGTSWLVRQQAFRQVAGVRFITLVATVAFQIVLGLLAPGATSLMLGFIGGYLAGFLRGAWHYREALASSARTMDRARMRDAAVEYRKFALVTAPSGVINGVGSMLPAWVLPSLYGLAMTGQWSLAARVLWQPVAFAGQAVNQVLWGTAARLQHDDPKRLWLLFVALNAGLLAAMTPALVLVWYGEELFALIFGPAWAEAGRYAGILVLGTIVSLAAQGTTSLHVYGLNLWMSAWEFARMAVVAATLAAAWWLGLSAMGCIVALTAANAVCDLGLMALNALAVWRIRAGAERPAPASPTLSRKPSA